MHRYSNPRHASNVKWMNENVCCLFVAPNENDANLVNAINFIDQTKTDEKPTEDRKSTRLNSSHRGESRMPSSA